MSWSIPQPDEAAIQRAKHSRYPDDMWPTPSWTAPELPPPPDREHDDDESDFDDDDIWCTD